MCSWDHQATAWPCLEELASVSKTSSRAPSPVVMGKGERKLTAHSVTVPQMNVSSEILMSTTSQAFVLRWQTICDRHTTTPETECVWSVRLESDGCDGAPVHLVSLEVQASEVVAAEGHCLMVVVVLCHSLTVSMLLFGRDGHCLVTWV